MSRQLTPEGMLDRTVVASYPDFEFSFTTWILGKAGDFWEQLKAMGRD